MTGSDICKKYNIKHSILNIILKVHGIPKRSWYESNLIGAEKCKKTKMEKYGNPYDEKEYWSDDLYKDDYSKYGFAVSLGHLSYTTEWRSPTTIIFAWLDGDNYKISHGVQYSSIELESLEKEQNSKVNDEKF
jgi:hypothetical protein